jgi:hypothetical protein
LCKYLDKEGIPYVVDYSSAVDEVFKVKARELISIEDLPNAISSLKWSFNKQSELRVSQCKKVQTALKNLRARQLVGIEPNDIMLTCSKDLWTDEPKGRGIKVGSRLYQANWIANTTRGTNAFSHCSHALYLYDQHLNPAIVRWLNVENKGAFDNDYALSEFIQWLYRSRVRKGEPVTVFFASSRMRSLVENWLYGDA